MRGLKMLSPDIDFLLAPSVPTSGQQFFSLVRSPSYRCVQRILLLALLFLVELSLLTVWLDGDSLTHRAGLVSIIHDWGAWILRGIVGFPVIFLTFAYLKNKATFESISRQISQTPIRWGLLAVHFLTMGIFLGLSFLIYGSKVLGPWPNLLVACWLIVGMSATAFAVCAFLGRAIWLELLSSTGYLWVYSMIAVVSACIAGSFIRMLWHPAGYLTFRLCKLFLTPFVSGIIANLDTMVIGTQRFRVEIAPQCSGLEGVGLILGFEILWLFLFRKEHRFPQSLVLVPVGIGLIFLLNSVRIAALILIGNAGAPKIAAGGFHSQAGWIAYCGVAVGFCFVAQRVPWFTTRPHTGESMSTTTQNPAAAFLVPFLMILAGGMIASAASPAKGVGTFEWLYPLRFFAAAGSLWFFRRSYANLNWRFTWYAPAIGSLAFAIWIGLDHFSTPTLTAEREVSAALDTLSPIARFIWITFRVLAAVITVPLAEELAFRGFLVRRLLSSDFETVSFRRFSWLALLGSSIVFGLLHGGLWIAGIIAGILFGLAVIRRGRIGDAVVAHATANALLAAYVLVYHKWHLW